MTDDVDNTTYSFFQRFQPNSLGLGETIAIYTAAVLLAQSVGPASAIQALRSIADFLERKNQEGRL